jgi:phage/plasmid-like protein (TIGR03299 family)
MAHEFTSGVMLNAQPAWHGLGQVIEGTLPADEAFRRAGALFPVEQLQLWAGDVQSQALLDAVSYAADQPFSSPEERQGHIQAAIEKHLISMRENRVAIWRPDERKILGTASPGYQIFPNQCLLDFASALREECDMDTVVVLRGGAKVAFTAKIRGTDREVVPGDKVFRNIVGYLGHDGSTAFGGIFTDIRVECANRLAFAMNDGNRHGRQFIIRHTENNVAQIDSIIASIDMARQTFDQAVDGYQAMREVPMTTELYRHFLERVYQVPDVKLDNDSTRPGRIDDMPRKWAALEQAWNYGLGRDIPGVADTVYWGLNAVTEVETSMKTKGAGKRRMHSSLFGSGAAVVKRANDLARELVTA